MGKNCKLKKISLAVLSVLIFISAFTFNVNADGVYVYLGGQVAGFTIKTEGATVAGVCDVITDNGLISPCKIAGINVGDVILNMNETNVNDAKDISSVLNQCDGEEIITRISSAGEIKIVDITPVKDVTGDYKLGLYVRDDLTGLGTVTYYNKDGTFASLGHPISSQNGDVLSVIGGNVYDASVIGVNKASKGKAGELKGLFIGAKKRGIIAKNTKVGLFGKYDDFNELEYRKIQCGDAEQGKAQIYSTVDGTQPKLYEIDIIKVDFKSSSNKNLVIKISDKQLLKTTGGILQGMSGSPIIQNNRLVGAVTHVFINDSSRGYGISIANMLN